MSGDWEPMVQEGGPAFPIVADVGNAVHIQYGMSLRDWFAGQVLPAVAAQMWTDVVSGHPAHQAAATAYAIADAMLKERGKTS